MRRVLFLLPFALAACGPSQKQYDQALADSRAVSAEKDSLLNEVLETTKFVTAVNDELARARTGGVEVANNDPGTPTAERDRAARVAALDKVKALVDRLNEAEAKLDQSAQRAKRLSSRNSQLLAQIEDYKKNLEELRTSAEQQMTQLTATIEDQKVQIATLGSQLDTARTVNADLTTRSEALSDTVSQLTSYKNTVYYVAGTEKELKDRGVVTKEGSKFLFFGGKHLVPARALAPESFTSMDKTAETVIPLPKADKKYKLVSRQSLDFVSNEDKDGKLQGEIRIEDPESFWAASKYLIVVED